MKVSDKLLKRSLKAAVELSVIKKKGLKDKVRKFDESVDLIINFKDINLNDPKNRIDKELILPNEVIKGDKPNICVIASDEILLQAKKAGLDTLDKDGLEAINREEKKSKKKFVKRHEFFIVEDKMMRDVARFLARFLGPVGKMPKPFPSGYGIINSVDDLNNAIDRYKRIIRVQMKKTPVVQTKIGKKSLGNEKIFENMKTVIDYIVDLMPHKTNNIRSMYLKTTMGRSVKMDEDYLKSVGV